MDKDTKNIIRQLAKRGIIGDLSDRDFDVYVKFVSYDKRMGLIKLLFECDYSDSRYLFYDDETFEKVASINVEWDNTPRFNNPNEIAGWDAFISKDFIFADELANILKLKGVTR